MILLDSDVVIDVLRGRPAALAWFDQVRAVQRAPLALPGFALMELVSGTRNSADVRDLNKLLPYFSVIWLSKGSCDLALERFAAVHLQNAIGIVDVLVAHIALEQSLPLHTFNTKHYAAIPELQTIQPYTR